MRKKRQRKIAITIISIVALLIIGFFSFGASNLLANKSSANEVKVGIMAGTDKDDQIWSLVKQIAKKKYNVDIKLVKFTDYSQPNKALENGSIDINAFQHYSFLNAWNKANKTDIVVIGQNWLKPLSLYSKKYTKLSQLLNKAEISVPNDATNESRSLLLLQSAGLIKLKSGKSLYTINDIVLNPKKIKIVELDASQTVRSLSDVSAAVINTNYAMVGKLGDNLVLYTEKLNKDSQKWICVFAALKKNKDNSTYKKVVKSFQNTQVRKLIRKLYGNKEIPAW